MAIVYKEISIGRQAGLESKFNACTEWCLHLDSENESYCKILSSESEEFIIIPLVRDVIEYEQSLIAAKRRIYDIDKRIRSSRESA